MVANLQGIRFDQIYGDNSGTYDSQQPYDTDGDGAATQEDEFVSITNTTGAPMDISGWQIWSDATGTGADDPVQDGLYHTFPSGTVLQPGETLYIINEISGPAPSWAQEASEGGVESDASDRSTNLLTEGASATNSEAVALVDPVSGDYIVFNMSPDPPQVQTLPGFPGTTNVGTVDGDSVIADQGAGVSYAYDASSDSYLARRVTTPCFVSGTLILTTKGPIPVERLRVGDPILTADGTARPIRWTGHRTLAGPELNRTRQHPIEFKRGSLGHGTPDRPLRVSPQHRMLIDGGVLAPARGLVGLPGIRVMQGCRKVTYHHLLLDRHEIIIAEGAPTESLLPGRTFLSHCRISDRLAIMRIAGPAMPPARPCLTVAETRRRVAARRATVPAP